MDKVCRRSAQTGDEHRVDIALTASQTARVLWRTSSPARSARRKAPLERPLSASRLIVVIGHWSLPAALRWSLQLDISLFFPVTFTLLSLLFYAPHPGSVHGTTHALNVPTHM